MRHGIQKIFQRKNTMLRKVYNSDKNVYEAAKERLSLIYREFDYIYVAFSAGKDSTILLNLAIEVAREQNKLPVNVMCIDFEALYSSTDEITRHYYDMPEVNMEWLCLPLHLRNAVSQYQPHWICWDPKVEHKWVRPLPEGAITDTSLYPFFWKGMEFEHFIKEYSAFKSEGGTRKVCTLVGIRSDESLNRFRTIVSQRKTTYNGLQWTTKNAENVYSAYPIYDWKTADIWRAFGKFGWRYNKVYDLMNMAGVPYSQQRLCQPFGDDQRSGLWLYKVIEPHTWNLLIERVNGVNFGARYVKVRGNVLGAGITLPDGHTWRSYAYLLLSSMPRPLARHYRKKIFKFIGHYRKNGVYSIPDEADPKLEGAKKVPSWRRICKTLLLNDYFCKNLSFGATKYDIQEKMKILNELTSKA